MLLPKHADKIQCHNLSPMKTTVIGHFLFRLNTIALFSGQIFKIDNTPVNASLIFWFCFGEKIVQSVGNLPWEITKYLIEGHTFWSNWHDLYAGIRTTQKGRQSEQAVSNFFLVPQSPQSFSGFAGLSLFARLIKTVMLCRLCTKLQRRSLIAMLSSKAMLPF